MNYQATIPTLIQKMKAATSLSELNAIKDTAPFKQYQKKEKQYPPLPFQISLSEIQALKDKGWIDTNNQLTVSQFKDASTLEQLLLSIIWKNGDLRKIARIIDGIESVEVEAKSYVPFYQFGQYLRDGTKGIIVDQHVIRAYRVITAISKREDVLQEILKKETLKGKQDFQLTEGYKKWVVGNDLIQVSIKQEPDYLQVMDDLLFAVGKYLKVSVGIKNN